MSEREHRTNPEERTSALFEQDYGQLAHSLLDQTIVVSETGELILITDTKGYSRNTNLKDWKYKPIAGMRPGTIWVCPFPLRKMQLTLVVAKDGQDTGACVRIKEARKFDLARCEFVEIAKEGDIASALGLTECEVAELKFLDDSDDLYLVRTGKIVIPGKK